MARISKADISKTENFFEFSFRFLKSTLNLNYFETKYQSHSLSITEIINCETGAYIMWKTPSSMPRFGRQLVNASQTLLRPARNQFHTTLPLIRDRGNRKRLVLVRFDLLEQFINILTADYQYSR